MADSRLVGVYTIRQAAALVNVSDDTLRREIKAGRLHARHIRSCVRILEDELQRWLHDYDIHEERAS